MDSLLLGTIIGGILTLAGNFLASYLNLRKEREQWARTQEAEETKWARDEQYRLRQELYDIYRNCLHYLSLILAECRANPGVPTPTDEIHFDESGEEHPIVRYVRKQISEDERLYRQEAQKWLWLLLLHVRNLKISGTGRFEYELNQFAQSISAHLPENLRENVLALAKNDSRLHSLAGISEPKAQPNNSFNRSAS